MALVFPRPLPAGEWFAQADFRLSEPYAVNELAGGGYQVMELATRRWLADFTTVEVDAADRQMWQAFLNTLRGGQRAFLAFDPEKTYPRAYGPGVLNLSRAVGGAFDGTGVLNSWTSSSLQILGLPANYRATTGDMISFDWNGTKALHQIAEDAVAQASGVLNVSVEPAVLALPPPTFGASVAFVRPACVMRVIPGTVSAPAAAYLAPVRFNASQVLTPTYQPETLQLRNRMSALPAGRLDLADALIYRLKAAGVWNKLDALWLAAAHDAASARLNWIGDRYNFTAVNSPPFTANRGFKNVASTGVGYLMTGFTGGSAADNWQKDSATVGVFSPVDGVNAQRAILGSSHLGLGGGLTDPGSRMMPRYNNVAGGTVNSVTNSALFDSPWTAPGSYIATRTDAATSRLYCNGALRRAETVAARQMSLPLFLMAENFGGGANFFSDDTIQAAFVGGGMSEADILTVHAAVTAYLGAVGA